MEKHTILHTLDLQTNVLDFLGQLFSFCSINFEMLYFWALVHRLQNEHIALIMFRVKLTTDRECELKRIATKATNA